jgi:hypothetical protein
LLPTALRDVAGTGPGPRTAGIEADFPVELLRANRRGMLRGPGAYLRCRWQGRRAPRAGSPRAGRDAAT